MDWRDEGILLSARPYGEAGAIADLFTREHGRHLGLVRGGASRRLKSVLQPGNTLSAHWRARLSEHLGTYSVELAKPRAGLVMEDPLSLLALSAACSVAAIIPEREVHVPLYEGFELLMDQLENIHVWPAIFVRWELGLLQELGFGLDLSQCVATGEKSDLAYVSPRSGGAVSAEAGAPYASRLFRLPVFMTNFPGKEASLADVSEGLRITGHFLERHLYTPLGRELPDARIRLAERLSAQAAESKL